jgi:hypothetical protein
VGTAGQRESRHGGKSTAPTAWPHRAAREREGVSALRLAPTGGARLSGTGGARARMHARAGLAPKY